MISQKKVFTILYVTFILLLTGCTNSNEGAASEENLEMVTIGQAEYAIQNIDASPMTKEIGLNEDLLVYYANRNYLVYGISYESGDEKYLLTKHLYTYDYIQKEIANKITFSEACYVGDAIVTEDGALYYALIPMNKVTPEEETWQIHGNVNQEDYLMAEVCTSFPFQAPEFALLEGNPIYVYENQKDDEYAYGCNLIKGNQASTIFENKLNISEANSNRLLSCAVASNGTTAVFKNYEDGVLYYTFMNTDGIISKYKVDSHIHHKGMIHDGLITSKVIDRGQNDAYYAISVIRASGEEDAFKTFNPSAHLTFTSSDKNESMVVDDHANLYLFQYEDNSLIRTKISIDPMIDGKAIRAFSIGDDRYLTCHVAGGNDLRLHVITIN